VYSSSIGHRLFRRRRPVVVRRRRFSGACLARTRNGPDTRGTVSRETPVGPGAKTEKSNGRQVTYTSARPGRRDGCGGRIERTVARGVRVCAMRRVGNTCGDRDRATPLPRDRRRRWRRWRRRRRRRQGGHGKRRRRRHLAVWEAGLETRFRPAAEAREIAEPRTDGATEVLLNVYVGERGRRCRICSYIDVRYRVSVCRTHFTLDGRYIYIYVCVYALSTTAEVFILFGPASPPHLGRPQT